MTPEHEAELRLRARDNTVLAMLVDLRDSTAFHEKPMDDEDFYHVALLTMTDVANTFQKLATEQAMRAQPEPMIYKGSES